jgi:hypothetical protein
MAVPAVQYDRMAFPASTCVAAIAVGRIGSTTLIRMTTRTKRADGKHAERLEGSNKKALGTDSHRGHLHCVLHIVNSSSRTDFQFSIVTEQVEHQRGQKQDADGSHLALHILLAFRLHSLLTLHAGRDSGNGVQRSRWAGWKDRPRSPGSMGCLFADLGHVPFHTDR